MAAQERNIAIVTGGESGIGAACAKRLAADGADVAILYYRDEAAAQAVRREVEQAGGRAIAVQGDVTDEALVERLFDRTCEALGTASILVNSAGVNFSGTPVAEMSLEEWERRIATNLTGCFLTSRRFMRDFLASGRTAGAIVNISSIHEEVMFAGAAAYDASKGGLRNLTRTMALETAAQGVTVNAIAPGMILTAMNRQAMEDEEFRRSREANIPMKRAGTPEEVAAIAAFLASPEAAYVTGTTVTIDGGLSLLLAQGA